MDGGVRHTGLTRAAVAAALAGIFLIPALSLAATTTDTPQNREQAAIKAGLSPDAAAKVNWADPKTSDLQCIPVVQECSCGKRLDPVTGQCVSATNKFKCQCTDPRGVKGICVDNFNCMAQTYTDLSGKQVGVDSGLQQLGQILGQLLQQLIQGGGGGGGGGTATTTCPNGYHTVHTPSSDPCARYVSLTSNLINNSNLSTTNGANNLLQALNGGTGDSGSGAVSVTITNNNTNTNTNTDTNANNADNNTSVDIITRGASSSTNGVTISGAGFPVLLAPVGGTTGDIQFTGNGATVIAGSVDAQSNTTIAGFYGSDTFGTQEPQGIAAQMCQNRPWANNFLSVVIPSAFFDSLCAWRGYQVGMPSPASAPVLQQTPVTQSPGAASTASQQPSIQPKVDIWAVPASVPLATRTTIYWNTQSVTDCTVSSSDGNFNQSSSSGGAATVPLTGSTTFTISCSAADGSPVTDSTIVDIAI